MNKNKKYILIALLASLLFTVTIGFSMWIILSEQTRGYIQSMGTLTLEVNEALYAGETWTYVDGEEGSPNYATVTYTHRVYTCSRRSMRDVLRITTLFEPSPYLISSRCITSRAWSIIGNRKLIPD